jgi:AP-3 complex subunit beta
MRQERFRFGTKSKEGEFSKEVVGKTVGKLLDSPKDADKLDGMKQVVSVGRAGCDAPWEWRVVWEACAQLFFPPPKYLSGGADVSYLFPDVVKNVVTKNMELKKLVYHFLVHYAELEPEASLLSINSFQKDLSDANPVIRALALRVLSSIRLQVIVQIVVLSIQKCLGDSSPYVRKAAAHAITKVYAMDPEQKPTLREFIVQLLNERSVAALGSAVAAFNVVCPDDWELIHPHYRKLCIMVVDSDEWSQVHLINALTRYARAHFVNPNTMQEEDERLRKRRQGWDSGDEDSDDAKKASAAQEELSMDSLPDMDGDHRLLLSALSPLLNCRNDQVVLAVVSAFFYVAPAAEAQRSGRALVRILRSAPEVQYIVLGAIVTMAAKRPSMFSQHVSEFFVRGSDPSYVARLKLEVLTHIADAINIHNILGEFNYNAMRDDKTLVAASVQAIGRVAANLPKVTDNCMSRLLAFLSNSSQIVVAESVIVIKKILQLYPGKYADAIERLARMLDKVVEPRARASIVWLIGEYAEKVALFAPDILRKLALSFASEVTEVKLQTLNLGLKLHFRMSTPQVEALFRFVLELASYDLNYDVRDKARLLQAVFSSNGHVGAEAQTLFLSEKPQPKFLDPSEGRHRFTIGSLSHILNSKLPCFLPLPEFPLVVDDAARALRMSDTYGQSLAGVGQQHIPDQWNEDEWGDSSESSEGGGEEEEDGEEESDEEDGKHSEESSSARSDSVAVADTFLASTDFDNLFSGKTPSPTPSTASASASSQDQASLLDSIFSGASTPVKSSGGNNNNNDSASSNADQSVIEDDPSLFYPPSPKKVLVTSGTGDLKVEYSFSRAKSEFGEKYAVVELALTNEGSAGVQGISVCDTKGFDVHVFKEIAEIGPGLSVTVDLSVYFASLTEPVNVIMTTDEKQFEVQLVPILGELIRPTKIEREAFAEEMLRADQEATFVMQGAGSKDENSARVYEVANLYRVRGGGRVELSLFGEVGLDKRVFVVIAEGGKGTVRSTDGDLANGLASYLSQSLQEQ